MSRSAESASHAGPWKPLLRNAIAVPMPSHAPPPTGRRGEKGQRHINNLPDGYLLGKGTFLTLFHDREPASAGCEKIGSTGAVGVERIGADQEDQARLLIAGRCDHRRTADTARLRLPVDLCATYWHFLLLVWLVFLSILTGWAGEFVDICRQILT